MPYLTNSVATVVEQFYSLLCPAGQNRRCAGTNVSDLKTVAIHSYSIPAMETTKHVRNAPT